MADLGETLALLDPLIAFPTVSAASNLDLIAFARTHLDRIGARVEIHPDPTGQKANLWATLGPEGDGGIVLSAHTDVVPVTGQTWVSDPFRLTRRGSRLYGRGTCDMKGFLAAALSAMAGYAGLPLTRPVHLALTHDEETGCDGAKALTAAIAARGLAPAIAIIGEPTLMGLIEAHKGGGMYRITVTGTDGHSSQPDRGVNAIHVATRLVARLLEIGDALRADAPEGSRFDPPWTTLQVGMIEGGIAFNVIPERCTVTWDLRPVRAVDTARVLGEIETFARTVLEPQMRAVAPAARIVVETLGSIEPFEARPGNRAVALLAELTGANGTDVVSYGTEAGIFQSTLGLDAVVCGPGSIGEAHRPDEFVEEAELARCCALLTRLGQHLT